MSTHSEPEIANAVQCHLDAIGFRLVPERHVCDLRCYPTCVNSSPFPEEGFATNIKADRSDGAKCFDTVESIAIQLKSHGGKRED